MLIPPAARRLQFPAFAAACLLSLLATAAPDDSVPAGGPGLGEPVAHVRGRAESVQWLPLSVTVIRTETAANMERHDLEDIEPLAPGLILDAAGSAPRSAGSAIRGIGSQVTGPGFDPTVAIMVDGVIMGAHSGNNPILFDVDQIEVTRGPSGVMQGPAALAGTINIRRRAPTNELTASAQLAIGEYSRVRADAVVNVPLGDGIAARLAINSVTGGGSEVLNVTRGEDAAEQDLLQGALGLSWQPRPSIKVGYTFDWLDDDSQATPLFNISDADDLLCADLLRCPNQAVTPTTPESLVPEHTLQNRAPWSNLSVEGHTLRIEADVPGHLLTSLTGRRVTDESAQVDLDATAIDFHTIISNRSHEQTSQELNLRSTWHEVVEYQVGLYWQDTDADLAQRDLFILDQLAAANLVDPAYSGESRVRLLDYSLASRTTAAWWYVEWNLPHGWQLDVGGRWNDIQRNVVHAPQGTRVDDTITLESRERRIGASTFTTGTGSVGLRYRVDDKAMVYGRWTHGYRAGGYDDQATSAVAASPYGIESSDALELGLKSDWWDDHLRVNVAVYNGRQRDRLEPFLRDHGTGVIEQVLDNVASVKTRGVELEWILLPLDRLTLRGAWAHQKSHYDRYAVPDVTGATTAIDRAGLVPTYAPPDAITVNARYEWPLAVGTVEFFAGYRYSNGYWTDSLVAQSHVSNWTQVDLSATWRWRDWSVRFYADNALDKRLAYNASVATPADIVPLPAGSTATPLYTNTQFSHPRLLGLAVSWRPFGAP